MRKMGKKERAAAAASERAAHVKGVSKKQRGTKKKEKKIESNPEDVGIVAKKKKGKEGQRKRFFAVAVGTHHLTLCSSPTQIGQTFGQKCMFSCACHRFTRLDWQVSLQGRETCSSPQQPSPAVLIMQEGSREYTQTLTTSLSSSLNSLTPRAGGSTRLQRHKGSLRLMAKPTRQSLPRPGRSSPRQPRCVHVVLYTHQTLVSAIPALCCHIMLSHVHFPRLAVKSYS